MLKETITYVDYNDVERTEDFYFNLTTAEVAEMELGVTGGLQEMMARAVAAQDSPTLVAIFKDIILKCYGEKSADGKRFIKSKELSEAFAQTPAYSILFMRLAQDADAAAKFINGVMPKNKQA